MENVPDSGACIVASSHSTYADPFILGTLLRRQIHFMIISTWFYNPSVHWFLKRMGTVPVRQHEADHTALRESMRYLRAGRIVGIFPEGMRNRWGRVGRARTGVIILAQRTGAPVVPVALAGVYEHYPPYAWIPEPCKVAVVFGEPITFSGVIDHGTSRKMLQQKADHLMDSIRSLQEKAYELIHI